MEHRDTDMSNMDHIPTRRNLRQRKETDYALLNRSGTLASTPKTPTRRHTKTRNLIESPIVKGTDISGTTSVQVAQAFNQAMQHSFNGLKSTELQVEQISQSRHQRNESVSNERNTDVNHQLQSTTPRPASKFSFTSLLSPFSPTKPSTQKRISCDAYLIIIFI